MKSFGAIAFTDPVRELQQTHGSRAAYAGIPGELPEGHGLGERETGLLHGADSIFIASVNADGWPYVQHRGGPRGFVRVLSPARIAFGDFRGNRQYVTAGNVRGDTRVALIVMDYPARRRLKLFGRLRFEPLESAGTDLVAAVELPDYRARIERVAVINVEAFDWNCPQHITPRFTAEQMDMVTGPLYQRIAQLEREIEGLRVGRPPT